jgi:hypothetical protein
MGPRFCAAQPRVSARLPISRTRAAAPGRLFSPRGSLQARFSSPCRPKKGSRCDRCMLCHRRLGRETTGHHSRCDKSLGGRVTSSPRNGSRNMFRPSVQSIAFHASIASGRFASIPDAEVYGLILIDHHRSVRRRVRRSTALTKTITEPGIAGPDCASTSPRTAGKSRQSNRPGIMFLAIATGPDRSYGRMIAGRNGTQSSRTRKRPHAEVWRFGHDGRILSRPGTTPVARGWSHNLHLKRHPNVSTPKNSCSRCASMSPMSALAMLLETKWLVSAKRTTALDLAIRNPSREI